MKELIEINAHHIREIGYDRVKQEHFIDAAVMHGNRPGVHRSVISEQEYIALCGWIQISTTVEPNTTVRGFTVTGILLKSVRIRTLDGVNDSSRMREAVTDTFVQQDRWERIKITREGEEDQLFWESRNAGFGFKKHGELFIYYTLERVAACPQVDTGHLPDVAEKLVDIAQSSLFPRVDYELQLRWRNGQTGIDAGYATVARIDKNAILAMGRLLGGKK
ncbi:hypothetical protein KWAN_90 [Erwinia phage vB_EamM_Kwan]|uniref:Uncharacterized protein n=1 Tax=Erwinia phage vB_EamM_Kwan TaxID=1883374 RepID=A0A1B2IDX3_9CAUD|nr:hypothetical protein BIZ80_gp209 [Erwinia phage vB_EamM_Kwan]ANZ49442.1 hypothetical protein KWAN_90 [Erwinia phage vB_EamM_Kwan]